MLRRWWSARPTHAWAPSGVLVKQPQDEDLPGARHPRRYDQ
jgi:hypothetical protein